MVLESDGKLDFHFSDGTPLPPKLIRQVKQNSRAAIAQFLEKKCQELNGGIDLILATHLATPSPFERIRYGPKPYTVPEPTMPAAKEVGLLDRILPGRRARIESSNQEAKSAWDVARAAWEHARAHHVARESALEREFEEGLYSSESLMAQTWEKRLASLDWPRETELTYELAHGGRTLGLDIDLPEVEDMPRLRAEVAASRFKLNIKRKSETQVRKDYMQYVHGILFRAIGEAFFSLPAVEQVLASGYSQRPDPATGRVRNDYLLSVRVERDRWREIDFDNLEAIDLVAALERFDLVREMSKTGVFKPITPLTLVQ